MTTEPPRANRRKAPAIAGVALALPRPTYTVEDDAFGRATWKRADTGRLSQGTLELELGEKALAKSPGQERRATFALNGWFLSATGRSYERTHPGSEHWRALVVEHGLLGRPELVRCAKARRVFESSPEVPAAVAGALAALAARFESLRKRTGRGYDYLECAGCRDGRKRRRAEQEDAARARREWCYLPTEPLEDCAHVPFAVAALERACELHPELTFEAIGWLVPEGTRGNRRDSPALTRFALEEDVHEAILGHWLLAEAPEERNRSRYGLSYLRRDWRALRRSFRLERRKATETEGRLPEHLSAALTFAAQAWGLDAPADELLAPEPATEPPALGPAAAPAKAAASRVLPEAGPERPATSALRRRRGSARDG